MKKILIILAFFAYAIGVNCQPSGYPVSDTLVSITDISGSDTTIYINMYNVKNVSIEFDYSDFDATDGTVEIGFSNFGNTHNNSDTDNFPKTLSDSTLIVVKDTWNSKYLSVKLTKGSNTSGNLIYSFIKGR